MTAHWHDDEFAWCPCDEPEGTCVTCRGTGQVAEPAVGPIPEGTLRPLHLAECHACGGTGNTTTP